MRPQIVLGTPVLNPATLLSRPSITLPYPFDEPTLELCPYGRVALLQGLKLLSIGAGDSVLIPSLICASVAAPFNALGIKIQYYDVDDSLQPRFHTALESLNSSTKALLAVNYFGFPQDVEAIRDFCAQHNLYYIEDNAHGFLSSASSGPLGAFGDIAIFSQRKTLPLPNGGGLLVNNHDLLKQSLPRSDEIVCSKKRYAFKFLLKNFLLNFGPSLGFDVISILRRFPSSGGTAETEESDLASVMEPYSRLTSWLLYRTDFEREKRVRRQSFKDWEDILVKQAVHGLSPVFDNLPEGTVPYAFPLRVAKRNEFIERFRRRGVGCSPWPTLPSTAPRTRLNEELVLVPTHSLPPVHYSSSKMNY